MDKQDYEYTVDSARIDTRLSHEATDKNLSNLINKYAKDGWKVASVVVITGRDGWSVRYTVTFERKMDPEREC